MHEWVRVAIGEQSLSGESSTNKHAAPEVHEPGREHVHLADGVVRRDRGAVGNDIS